jgi:hypothetical protein
MTLASILILSGIVCLVMGAALPLVYGLRMRLAHRRRTPHARARIVGATGAIGGVGPR